MHKERPPLISLVYTREHFATLQKILPFKNRSSSPLGILFLVKPITGEKNEKQKMRGCYLHLVKPYWKQTALSHHLALGLQLPSRCFATKASWGEEDLECCKVQEPTTHAVCGGLMILSGVWFSGLLSWSRFWESLILTWHSFTGSEHKQLWLLAPTAIAWLLLSTSWNIIM